MFGDKTIEKKVMAVVKGKIAGAQKKFDELKAKEEASRDVAHAEVDKKHDANIESHADNLVKEILGKVL